MIDLSFQLVTAEFRAGATPVALGSAASSHKVSPKISEVEKLLAHGVVPAIFTASTNTANDVPGARPLKVAELLATPLSVDGVAGEPLIV